MTDENRDLAELGAAQPALPTDATPEDLRLLIEFAKEQTRKLHIPSYVYGIVTVYDILIFRVFVEEQPSDSWSEWTLVGRTSENGSEFSIEDEWRGLIGRPAPEPLVLDQHEPPDTELLTALICGGN